MFFSYSFYPLKLIREHKYVTRFTKYTIFKTQYFNNQVKVLHKFLFQFCPNLRKIGNLLSWNVSEQEVEELVSMAVENRYDIEIMYKKMIMR